MYNMNMEKIGIITFYKILADLIFIFHLLIVLVVLFGWTVPQIWFFYMSVLILSLTSGLILGYCFLSKWEFNIRKKINPQTTNGSSFITYYIYKVTNYRISDSQYAGVSNIFLISSILLNLYLRYR